MLYAIFMKIIIFFEFAVISTSESGNLIWAPTSGVASVRQEEAIASFWILWMTMILPFVLLLRS